MYARRARRALRHTLELVNESRRRSRC